MLFDILAYGQTLDSLHNLKSFTVYSNVKETLNSDSILNKNSFITFQNDMSSALQMNTPYQVIQSSVNGYLTTNARGLGSNRNQVIWNDLPMESPFLGITDLSLFPASIFSHVLMSQSPNLENLFHTNAGTQTNLNQEFKKELNLFSSYSSIHNSQSNASLGFTIQNRINIQLFGGINISRNRFTYPSYYSINEIDTMKYAELKSYFYGAHLDFKTKSIGHKFSWFNTSHQREIPPLRFETYAGQKQSDRNTRLTYVTKIPLGNRVLIAPRIAYFRDFINYVHPVFSTNDSSSAETFFFQLPLIFNYKKFGLQVQNNFRYINSMFPKSVSYDKIQWSQNSTHLKVKYNLKRFDFVNQNILIKSKGNHLEWIPRLLIRWKQNKLSSAMSVGKIYRVPTLNDLYWRPGGNLNLKPEKGWQMDFVINYQSKKYNLTLNPYLKRLSNGLVWLPKQGENYWFVSNFRDIEIEGLEGSLSFIDEWGAFKFSLEAKFNVYQLAYAQNELLKPEEQNQINHGQNLILTTQFKRHKLGIYFKNYQEKTLDNQYKLLNINYETIFKNLIINVSVDNLLNEYYELRLHAPMPGRFYTLSIAYQIKFKHKKQ